MMRAEETHKRSVGEALRRLRERSELRLLDVASKSGLSVAEVRQAELGNGEIRFDTLARFLGAVGASWQEFFFVLKGKEPEDLAEIALEMGGALLTLGEQLRRSAG
jgi:transcriptional regulator with XRE-family HTH domain